MFDSSYQRGAPAEFPLDRVVPGFQKAIAGQQVGSTVAVAMTSADGYPDGQPAAGIQQATPLFAIKILDASSLSGLAIRFRQDSALARPCARHGRAGELASQASASTASDDPGSVGDSRQDLGPGLLELLLLFVGP